MNFIDLWAEVRLRAASEQIWDKKTDQPPVTMVVHCFIQFVDLMQRVKHTQEIAAPQFSTPQSIHLTEVTAASDWDSSVGREVESAVSTAEVIG